MRIKNTKLFVVSLIKYAKSSILIDEKRAGIK
jgi:hypothetical protein